MRGLAVAFRVAGTVVMLAVVVPAFVVLATMVGLEPTHWLGVRLHHIELFPFQRQGFPESLPEPVNLLISNAGSMDQAYLDDLAPSYWDAGARQVVLGAVTERGVSMRRALGESAGVAYRIERRPHSAGELATIRQNVPWDEPSLMQVSVDEEGNRMELTVTFLSHGLFTGIARYGDAIAIAADPSMRPVIPVGPPPDPTSWRDWARPWTTWFTLATGLPWYLATGIATIALMWRAPIRRRLSRRSRTEDLQSPSESP